MISTASWHAELERRRAEIGMSKSALAKRARVSLPTVNRILSGKEQRPAIQNVQALAAALNLEIRLGVGIAVDELQTAHEFRKQQAFKKAKRLVDMVQGTMALEAQAVDSKVLAEMVERTAFELLTGPSRRLWDE